MESKFAKDLIYCLSIIKIIIHQRLTPSLRAWSKSLAILQIESQFNTNWKRINQICQQKQAESKAKQAIPADLAKAHKGTEVQSAKTRNGYVGRRLQDLRGQHEHLSTSAQNKHLHFKQLVILGDSKQLGSARNKYNFHTFDFVINPAHNITYHDVFHDQSLPPNHTTFSPTQLACSISWVSGKQGLSSLLKSEVLLAHLNCYSTSQYYPQMSNPIFHHKLQQPTIADAGHLELGNQLLAFLKLFIYCLVAFKFFQLIFLKFRKQLSVSDRVQKKYKYSHNELLETYTESEAKLMEITISNTIKNAQVMPSNGLGRKNKTAKQVSFKQENNCYHSIISTRNCSEIDDEEFKELEIESQLFKESCESESKLTEAGAEAEGKLGEEGVRLPLIAEVEGQAGAGAQQESQLSQQTQSSAILENKQRKDTANPSCSKLATQQTKTQ